jgi:hypothetical protein
MNEQYDNLIDIDEITDEELNSSEEDTVYAGPGFDF